jgi:hypothetical protein
LLSLLFAHYFSSCFFSCLFYSENIKPVSRSFSLKIYTNVLAEQEVYPFGVWFPHFRQDAHAVEVIKIQGAKPCHASCRMECAFEMRFFQRRAGRCGAPLRASLRQYAPADALDGVVVAKVTAQPDKTLLAGRPEGNILALLYFIAVCNKIEIP